MPVWNSLIHGTHVVAAHAMGAEIGIDSMALFAAVLDRRISAVDLDLAGCSFEKRNLPLVSCVLQHGDVLQWAALLADRKLVLRNVPAETGNPAWLASVFAAVGNPTGVEVNPR